MIVYCDTSALLKLFVDEEHSAALAAKADAADAIAVSRLAWPEAMSALARRTRDAPRDAAALSQARQSLVDRWADFAVVELNAAVAALAGDYVDAFALRAYDGVQLASLQTLRLHADTPVTFACFDARLVKAAAVLGIAAA